MVQTNLKKYSILKIAQKLCWGLKCMSINEPLFLNAPLHDKIWGGTNLTPYGFTLSSDHVGEAWIVSAHDHGTSTILNGTLAGQTLKQAWDKHPELFGGHPVEQAFPMLVKILDANKDLSIQVHPADEYARAHGDKYGKTESWYILYATPDAKLYFGHKAQTREELAAAVHEGRWDDILRTVPVHAGEFVYVPTGTLHALGAGIVALETQQSSDTTFRFYDFDRTDAHTGKLRPLQIDPAIEVTTVPHQDYPTQATVKDVENGQLTLLVDAQYFAVAKLEIHGTSHLWAAKPYQIMTVIAGNGEIKVNDETYPLIKGQSLILPTSIDKYELSGDLTLIMSHENR